jgi:exopolysaccharide biosynthesis protein
MDRVPFGLTTPETAALMGALGCVRAVALDGGISAQLRVGAREWAGMRRVPVGMVVESR